MVLSSWLRDYGSYRRLTAIFIIGEQKGDAAEVGVGPRTELPRLDRPFNRWVWSMRTEPSARL